MASETENNAGGNKKVIDAIIRYQAGETEAFTDFYLGTEKMVLKFCLDMLHNKEDAEDVSQLVYTRAYRKLDLLNDPKAYGQWLKVISVNLCKNFIEKDSKNKTTDIDEYQNYEENGWDDFDNLPDHFIEDEQKREIINKILKESLSDVQFQTLWLRYFADKSEQQIAEIMGCSLGTVKSRTNSAKTKFRDALEKYVDKNKIVLSAVPFLTRYLKYQGTGKAMKGVPSVPIAASTAKAAGAAKTAGAVATAKAGFLSTTIGKAAVSTFAVLLTGGIAAAVLLNLPQKAKEPEETTETIETTESEEITKPEVVPTQTKPVPATTDTTTGTTVKREATVYEAGRITGTNPNGKAFDYAVPGVSITGLDMTDLNNQLEESVEGLQAGFPGHYGNTAYWTSERFFYYISDDYISIISIVSEDGYQMYFRSLRIIDIATGESVGKDRFLEGIGMSNDEFERLALDTLNLVMDEDKDFYDDDQIIWPSDSEYDAYRSSNLTLRDYNTRQEALNNCIPFYSERGHLCFVLRFNSGLSNIEIFDTETHEHFTGYDVNGVMTWGYDFD